MDEVWVDDNELIEPDCWDSCCRPHRHPDQFDGPQVVFNNQHVVELMKYNQVGVVTLLVISFAIVAVWSCFSIVPGFSLYDGTSDELTAVSHTGWWLAIDVLVLLVGGLSVFLAFSLNQADKIEISVHRMSGWLIFFVVLLSLGILSNIFHVVLSSTELSRCTSTLCTDNQPFLITLIAMLGALAFIKGWTIYRVITYNSNMKYAFGLVEDRDVTLERNTMKSEIDVVVTPKMKYKPIKKAPIPMQSPMHFKPIVRNSRHGFKTK